MLSILIFSCKEDDDTIPTPDTQRIDKLLDLVNEYRSAGCNCGDEYFPPVEPVVWNDLLEEAAQNHSNDMYENDYFDHTTPDGISPGDRITATGYGWSTYGENIALGYSTEEAVIEGWINSPGHCKNIMNGNLTEMGVGENNSYWTQVLASPNN